jgi:hypothetical protein
MSGATGAKAPLFPNTDTVHPSFDDKLTLLALCHWRKTAIIIDGLDKFHRRSRSYSTNCFICHSKIKNNIFIFQLTWLKIYVIFTN